MNLENIKEFIELAKSEGVAELKYEEKDLKISVNFNSTSATIQHTAMPAGISAQPAQAPVASGEKFHEITSPFVGTYYGSPSPDKPAFVNVGDRVSVGQTLCILEAMKIMNEIESDVNGEVIEICVDNESLCEFGQAILKIRV